MTIIVLMRGSNTLFADIFPEETLSEKQRKGRSENLNERRNECLIDRYFYYASKEGYRLRYDFIIKTISVEFFLSEITIPQVIEKNSEYLSKLKKQQPSFKLFQQKWPHLVW